MRKGVVCQVTADASMPVDQNGNRADCVIYGMSTIRRMNIGRAYEQFINAASRDLTHRIRRNADFDPKVGTTKMQAMHAAMNNVFVEESWDLLIRYYEIVSPRMHELLVDDHDGHARHVKSVLEDGIYIYLPPDSPNDFIDMCRSIRDSEYCPHYGPVTYMGPDGELVPTVGPVLIGSLYMIMLEKTGEDVSGVASVNRNHFGVPAKLNNQDKQSKPLREQPVRCSGESETRSQVSTAGPEFTVELLDLSNNPEAHRRGVEHILEADKPTDIPRLVDRSKIPYGGSRPVLLVKHLLECQGMKFVYEKSE